MHRHSYTIFWSDLDDGYIAISPEFPRLSAFGDSPEAALTELRGLLDDAVEVYKSEGWPVPASGK
jgi:predicted RNase H-like HicB family nuclease